MHQADDEQSKPDSGRWSSTPAGPRAAGRGGGGPWREEAPPQVAVLAGRGVEALEHALERPQPGHVSTVHLAGLGHQYVLPTRGQEGAQGDDVAPAADTDPAKCPAPGLEEEPDARESIGEDEQVIIFDEAR
ncbi:hypothetical protein [Streptomyces sp. NBC_00140]|uniref:hypothetical protein n=1 Tax=Streptomyces sp. NBC_00140 TaxID=2975664 RepID=UPI0022540B75|nr:hypothetical protein [Streptomyces sp. NBC_00140]MCX5334547.1 hypothetical protein [Streptomyces sp. NBC_00140]